MRFSANDRLQLKFYLNHRPKCRIIADIVSMVILMRVGTRFNFKQPLLRKLNLDYDRGTYRRLRVKHFILNTPWAYSRERLGVFMKLTLFRISIACVAIFWRHSPSVSLKWRSIVKVTKCVHCAILIACQWFLALKL